MQINGHKFSLALVISSLVAGGSLLTWVGSLASDNADVKRRVQTIEERQKEDRRELKADQKEIKSDVRETKETVNKILIKLEAIEQRRRDGR